MFNNLEDNLKIPEGGVGDEFYLHYRIGTYFSQYKSQLNQMVAETKKELVKLANKTKIQYSEFKYRELMEENITADFMKDVSKDTELWKNATRLVGKRLSNYKSNTKTRTEKNLQELIDLLNDNYLTLELLYRYVSDIYGLEVDNSGFLYTSDKKTELAKDFNVNGIFNIFIIRDKITRRIEDMQKIKASLLTKLNKSFEEVVANAIVGKIGSLSNDLVNITTKRVGDTKVEYNLDPYYAETGEITSKKEKHTAKSDIKIEYNGNEFNISVKSYNYNKIGSPLADKDGFMHSFHASTWGFFQRLAKDARHWSMYLPVMRYSATKEDKQYIKEQAAAEQIINGYYTAKSLEVAIQGVHINTKNLMYVAYADQLVPVYEIIKDILNNADSIGSIGLNGPRIKVGTIQMQWETATNNIDIPYYRDHAAAWIRSRKYIPQIESTPASLIIP